MTRHLVRLHTNNATDELQQTTIPNRNYCNPGNRLMPLWEVAETRKSFWEVEARMRRSLVADIETPLVRDETNSRDQVVFAHEKETVIVSKKL